MTGRTPEEHQHDSERDEHRDQSDWVETEPGWRPLEVFHLNRLELLDEVVHTVRGTVLRHLREPRTVGQLAELMSVPITRLYHHVNRLEADGLIRVDATRPVGGVTERRYRTIARRLELAPELYEEVEGAQLGRALGGLFDLAKASMQREFELGSHFGHQLDDLALLTLGELHLTGAQRDDLLERLRSIFEEFTSPTDERRADSSPFKLFVAAFPVTP